MSIYIFSKPIHSGKTTALLQWSKHKNCAGILMPDINGSKKFYDIETEKYFDAECNSDNAENLTIIGKYRFDNKAFDKANAIIIAAIAKPVDYFVIDEIGKLELDKKGFYPALISLLQAQQQLQFNVNILLVVRDSLLQEVVSFFSIEKFKVFII